ncbi:TPA: hypothetical protein EYO57_08835, partial [Candidatus Poribacteria bacterium]|nr:hypothetical protein [Candidatus Poribacteria bacterium]
MSRVFHKADQLESRSDVIAESCLVSEKYVVFQDIILLHDGELKAYKLKADHVPTKLNLRDPTIEASAALSNTVLEWLRYSAAKGWFFEVHEVFPQMYIIHDFDRMKIGEHGWSPEVANLQSQIDSLDALFNTESEHLAQIVTDLQNAGAINQHVATVVGVETTARGLAVSGVQSNLDAEAGTRSSADNVLTQSVSDEVAARGVAVSGVQSNLDAEAGTRSSADNVLTQSVSDEVSARG